jgi:phosphate transport system permease protein
VTSRRRLANRVATGWMVVSLVLALIPLALILGYVILKGAGTLSWSFFTQNPPFDASQAGGGYGNAIVGTLKLLLLSSLMAIPVGILASVYLHEYGRGSHFAQLTRFISDLMTGVPSIFIGMFVYSLIVVPTGHFSAFSGAVALALLMVPIITRGCEEVLRLVPKDLSEGSLALGAPRWRTVVSIVLPAASSGLVTVVMLSVARAAGETAPLLFTSFGNQFTTGISDYSSPDSALPLLIYNGAGSAYAAAQDRAWAGALVLIALVLILTVAARTIATRGSSLTRGV